MKAYITVLIIVFFFTANAQRRQSITLNGLGTTPLLGIKYDSRFSNGNQDGLGASIGVGAIEIIDDGSNHKASLSVGPNYLIGTNNHQLLLGANAVFVFSRYYPIDSSPENKTRVMFIPDIGYRYSPKENGFTAQLTWNPLKSNLDKERAYYYFGIGIGYSWK